MVEKIFEVLHSEVWDTLTAVREIQWIVKGQAAVKKVLH